MSWRTRGLYSGLSDSDRKFLEDFNRDWDTKSEGRSRVDALDCPMNESLPLIPSPEIQFNGELDASFILATMTIASFSVPKKANNQGWRIRIKLKSGECFKIHFNSIESALHLYNELLEFRQWFRGG
jgi:hypothetical protein